MKVKLSHVMPIRSRVFTPPRESKNHPEGWFLLLGLFPSWSFRSGIYHCESQTFTEAGLLGVADCRAGEVLEEVAVGPVSCRGRVTSSRAIRPDDVVRGVG